MKFVRKVILPIFVATVWIGISEFFRNEILLKNYWIKHYQSLGFSFPSSPINNAIWGIWSLMFAISLFFLAKKFGLIQSTLLSWFMMFAAMWVTIGNLGVLPYETLLFAIPLSLLESFVATYLIKKLIIV